MIPGRTYPVIPALIAAGLSWLAPASGQETPALSFRMPAPDGNLRAMLREHVFRKSAEQLAEARRMREAALKEGNFLEFRDRVRRNILEVLGEMPFGSKGGPLNVRAVSRHDRGSYRIENVLYESLPGWDVNASVYLPEAGKFPPPWPAIVFAVGHSGKQFESYQTGAQVFARCGWLALVFDPPGQASEKRQGNDHFRDGVRWYLTGGSSERHFVIDALRSIDYLQTRADVEMRNGVAMTGISGGGYTTMYAAPLDERIKAAGPSAFATEDLVHPLGDGFPTCPETLSLDIYPRGLDSVNLLAAAYPTPMLMMAGAKDEVFLEKWTRALADRVQGVYRSAGSPERFRSFMDDAGHEYTVEQALEFVRWADRWVRRAPGRTLPVIRKQDLEMAPYEVLKCYPRQRENMLTMVTAEAARLEAARPAAIPREALLRVARCDGRPFAAPEVKSTDPFRLWEHSLRELLIRADRDVELPATVVADRARHGGGILYFDERGRWTELVSGGMLSSMIRLTDRQPGKPTLLTVDLRGWGDTRSAPSPYDASGWASPQRSLAWSSAALGDPVLAMRIRDGLQALALLRSVNKTEPERIVVGGWGMGAVVALHVAAIDRRVAGVFASDVLASFRLLAEAETYAWDEEAFLPEVLKYYDLPQLVAHSASPVLVVNPLDGMKRPLAASAANGLYAAALENGRAVVLPDIPARNARAEQERWVARRLR